MLEQAKYYCFYKADQLSILNLLDSFDLQQDQINDQGQQYLYINEGFNGKIFEEQQKQQYGLQMKVKIIEDANHSSEQLKQQEMNYSANRSYSIKSQHQPIRAIKQKLDKKNTKTNLQFAGSPYKDGWQQNILQKYYKKNKKSNKNNSKNTTLNHFQILPQNSTENKFINIDQDYQQQNSIQYRYNFNDIDADFSRIIGVDNQITKFKNRSRIYSVDRQSQRNNKSICHDDIKNYSIIRKDRKSPKFYESNQTRINNSRDINRRIDNFTFFLNDIDFKDI